MISFRIPRGPGSPPATINHSPPRKLTAKDMNDWKIPPCISNWKNAKGYTIPLEMRISADGRTL
jgi:SNW domain-containing protein 1